MKKAQFTIKSLKNKLAKFSEKGSDQRESLKLKHHIKTIWKCIALGSEKAGLTVKEKKELVNEYEEWFPSEDLLSQFEGTRKDAVNILQNLPINFLEELTTPMNSVNILYSIVNQDANEASHDQVLPLEVESLEKTSVTESNLAESIVEDLDLSGNHTPDALLELNDQMMFESALLINNQANLQSPNANNFGIPPLQLLPIFSVPKCISPLPETPPPKKRKRELEVKSAENTSSDKSTKKIEFQCLSDNLTLKSKINQNPLDPVRNAIKSRNDFKSSDQPLEPSKISNNVKYDLEIQHCENKLHTTYAQVNRPSNCEKTVVANTNAKLEFEIPKCSTNKILDGVKNHSSLLTKEHSGLETKSCTKKNGRFLRRKNCKNKLHTTYTPNRSSNCDKAFVTNTNTKFQYKNLKCNTNKILDEGVKKQSPLLNGEHSGLETQSRSKTKSRYLRRKRYKMKKKESKKVQSKPSGNLLTKFFQDFHEIQSEKNFNYDVQSLVEILINQDNISNSVLLFPILNYLQNSKKDPLLTFSLNEDSSVLLPLDEECIVTALCMIELKKEPSLDGLLRTAITTINHLILAKKFSIYGLASLCRVFTELCKRGKDSVKPVILCGDLLKIRNPRAPFLIASVAGVWKELFQVGDNLPVEEKLFHSSILYGVFKKPKLLIEPFWKASVLIISKYFTAPPVNDARSAIQILKNFIDRKCQNDSWDSEYMTSALTILAVYEDWDWIKVNLLDNYVVPNLTQFGRRTLNRVAFDLYCNLYVDIWFLKKGVFSYENDLSGIFNNPEIFPGATFVRECVALALIRFIYMKNKLLPPFLVSWFQNNHQRPFVQKIEPVFRRKLMSENERELLLQDIQ